MYLKPHQRVVRTVGVLLYLLVLWVVWESDLKEGASWWVWLFYGVFVFLFCGVQAFSWLHEAVTGLEEAESIYLKYASRALRHTNLLLQQGGSKMRPHLSSTLMRSFAISVSVAEKCRPRVHEILRGVRAIGSRLRAARLAEAE